MIVNLLSLSEGAKKAHGVVVIIDVYRAFTTQSYAFERGVNSIINVADTKKAINYKSKGYGYYCMGEIEGKRPKGFDFGNSPKDLENIDINKKILIHCTMNGTTGAQLAQNADVILGGALTNAKATANYIKSINPSVVSLVAMGSRNLDNSERRTEEDELCAIYIKSILDNSPLNPKTIVELIKSCKESKKFGDPIQPQYTEYDKIQAMRINEFEYPIIIKKEDNFLISTKA